MLWTVAILQQGLTRKVVSSDRLAYRRNVRAKTRREAIEKCLSAIRALLTAECDKSIKYVDIYCGRKGSVTGSAFRLWPVQVVRATGKLRE